MFKQIIGEFVPVEIALRVEPMLRIQGYTNLEKVRPVIKKTAARMAQTVVQCCDAKVYYRNLPVTDVSASRLTLADGTAFSCEAFARFHARSEQAVVFILTLGQRLDDEAGALDRQELLLEQLFLETAGWLGVEAVNKQFVRYLREEAGAQGWRITRRMGPGYTFKKDGRYCMWTLADQSALFGLFDDVKLPVSVLDSGAMLPRMSRTGLYGLVPMPIRHGDV